MDVANGTRKPVTFSGDMIVDEYAERAYVFDHAWRQVREKFLDPELHGTDWDFYRAEYERFLPRISNDRDFAEMLSEMLGELNASHTGARYRPNPDNPDETGALGLYFSESAAGPGLTIAEVIEGGPLDRSDSRVQSGSVLTAVNGTVLADSVNLYQLLNRTAGDNTLLAFATASGGDTWEETVQPVSLGAERQLVYRRWVERRRALTDSLSDGRVGYVHIPSMNDPSFRTLLDEAFGMAGDREALIIDTRFNGGGDLTDDISMFMSGERYQDVVDRDTVLVAYYSPARWTRPSAVLVGESNYSDGHCSIQAYRHYDIGPVIGMPIPGTCSFVWWETVQGGRITFGIPNIWVTDGANGPPLENRQLEPDIMVRNEWVESVAGRDEQLEVAVTELLNRLPATGP